MADWSGYVRWFYSLSPEEQRAEWEKLAPDQRAQFEAARAGSSPAAAPPSAGAPPAGKGGRSTGRKLLLGCGILGAVVLLVIVGLAILGSLVDPPERRVDRPDSGTEAQAAPPEPVSPEEVAAQEEERKRQDAERAQRALADKWRYAATTDEMSSRVSRTAEVRSENTVDFDFPYSGRQHATLQLRSHPTFGRDVIFLIERGQLLCRQIDRCEVRVRFDDGQAQTWTARPPADHSTTHLFLDSYDRFLQQMRRAQVVRIQPEVYQEGSPIFEFQVGGYDHARYTGG